MNKKEIKDKLEKRLAKFEGREFGLNLHLEIFDEIEAFTNENGLEFDKDEGINGHGFSVNFPNNIEILGKLDVVEHVGLPAPEIEWENEDD